VQCRWMYPFERALKRLRHMVDNKARVEGCIAKKKSIQTDCIFHECIL
jgi:hypothetical protein